MKLFPPPLVTWQEPAVYAYRKSKNRWILSWIYNHWPTLLPLTGPSVTLYEDRITRQSPKEQIYIAVDNIDQCSLSTQSNQGISYSVLAFIPKKAGLARKVMGILTETAVSDSLVVQRVIDHLRERGIAIHQSEVK